MEKEQEGFASSQLNSRPTDDARTEVASEKLRGMTTVAFSIFWTVERGLTSRNALSPCCNRHGTLSSVAGAAKDREKLCIPAAPTIEGSRTDDDAA